MGTLTSTAVHAYWPNIITYNPPAKVPGPLRVCGLLNRVSSVSGLTVFMQRTRVQVLLLTLILPPVSSDMCQVFGTE